MFVAGDNIQAIYIVLYLKHIYGCNGGAQSAQIDFFWRL